MKLSRRGVMGTIIGAGVAGPKGMGELTATQMRPPAPTAPKMNYAGETTLSRDECAVDKQIYELESIENRIKACTKTANGEIHGWQKDQLEDIESVIRDNICLNIESYKSVSPTAKYTIQQRKLKSREREQFIEQAKKELKELLARKLQLTSIFK